MSLSRLRAWLGRHGLGTLVIVVTLVWALLIVAKRFSPHNYLARDGSFYATMNRSIATAFTLEQSRFQPRSWYQAGARDMDQAWSNVALGRGGTWWPKHSYLMPVASTPLYVWFGNLGLLAFNVATCVLLVWLLFQVAARFAPAWAAALAALALLASPGLADHVYKYSHDLFAAALVAAALALIARARWLGAGVVAGLALWAKATSAAVVIPAACVFLIERGAGPRGLPLRLRPGWRRFALGALGPLAAYALANWFMFGAPWVTSYDRIIVVKHGVVATESVKAAFDRPRGAGTKLLLGRGDGLLQLLPLAYLGTAGLVLAARRSWALAAAAVLSLGGYLWLFGTYRWAHARFFFPWLPWIAIGLATLPADLAALVRRFWPRLPLSAAPAPPPEEGAPTLGRRGRLVLAAGAFVLLGATAARAASVTHPPRLSGRTTTAAVFAGERPCDYYNPQREKWECPRQGEGVWHFIGKPERGQCRFHGVAAPAIWAPPDPSGAVRRLVFAHVPRAAAAELSFGQDDAAAGAGATAEHAAKIEVLVDGAAAGSFAVAARGRLERAPLPPGALARDDNTVEVRVTGSHEAHVCFDLAW